MKRALVPLIIISVVGAGCSAGTAASTSAATTSTSLAPSTTTTLPQLVDGGLLAVDPETLIPLEGAEPILVADWFDGVTSPNGAYAAIQAFHNETNDVRIALVDIASGTVVTEVAAPFGGVTGLVVDDEGTAHWLGGGAHLSLYRVSLGDEGAATIYERFPPDFYGQEVALLDDGRFGVYGTSHGEVRAGLASVVLIEPDTGTHVEIRMEHVVVGYEGQPTTEGEVPVLAFSRPAPVWDIDRQRFLLVESARDAVTEVDLATGAITEHVLAEPASLLDRVWAFFTPAAHAKGPSAGTSRDAVLSSDGRHLFVATEVTETEVSGIDWETNITPRELMVVDVHSWEVSVLDIVASRLHMSPDRVHLLAHGADVTEGGAAAYEVIPSPVHVIDLSTAEVLISLRNRDQSISEIQFTHDGSLAYLETVNPEVTMIDIFDMSLLQLTGSVSFHGLSLVGEAAYMAFHVG